MTITKDAHQAAAGTNSIICDIDIDALKILHGKKGYMAAEEAIHKVLSADFSPAEKTYTLKAVAEIMATKDSGTLEELKAGREMPWNAALHAAGGDVKTAEILFKMTIGMMKSESPETHLGYWVHQVCHLLEEYGSNWAPPNSLETRRDSLLQEPAFYPATEILLNELVKRLEALNTQNSFVGNLDRILTPTALMNIDGLVENPNLNTWRFMPASLNNEAVLSRVDDVQKAMFSSATPDDFCTLLTTGTLTNVGTYSKTTLEKLRNYIVARGGEADMPDFLQTEKPQEAPAAVLDVVVYDVDGTLLDIFGNLNLHVYAELEADIAAKEHVQIRTGGHIADKTNGLRFAAQQAGLPLICLPVQSKYDLRDVTVKKLVDDTDPKLQGFGAVEWIHPDSLKQPKPTDITFPPP